ncbi:acyltransferase [Amylibacter sp.]|nr:acyltransferase [Amylibacter sp.]
MKVTDNNNFDILRNGLAVVVFFTHWNILTSQNMTAAVFHMSGLAVDMFFVVSGFLIWWSYDGNQRIGDFFLKRFFRVFPLYAILICVQTIFFAILSGHNNLSELVNYFFANIVFLNFLAPTVGEVLSGLQVDAINGSLWTLKNEVVFYALIPTLYACHRKIGVYFLILLYVLSVCYMFAMHQLGYEKLLVQFPAQLRLFLVGILIYLFCNRLTAKNIYWLTGLAFISISMFREIDYFRFLFYPILLGIVVLFVVYYLTAVSAKFDFSYSFYIFHFPIIQVAVLFGINPENPIVSFLSLFVIALIFSYFSEKYIEKYFIAIGRGIIKRKK